MQSSKQWLAIKMLKELSEDHHIMKKLQSETNTSLIEMYREQQQGDEAKNQINDLGDEEAKTTQNKKSISQNNQKKKESKEMTTV